MTADTKGECRQSFEEWCRQGGQTGDIATDPNGKYFDSTSTEWKAYQAAWANRQAVIDELVEAGDALYAMLWKTSPSPKAISEAKEKWRAATGKAAA